MTIEQTLFIQTLMFKASSRIFNNYICIVLLILIRIELLKFLVVLLLDFYFFFKSALCNMKFTTFDLIRITKFFVMLLLD